LTASGSNLLDARRKELLEANQRMYVNLSAEASLTGEGGNRLSILHCLSTCQIRRCSVFRQATYSFDPCQLFTRPQIGEENILAYAGRQYSAIFAERNTSASMYGLNNLSRFERGLVSHS